jgi:Dullard-like phosphatase family protein
LYEANSIL